MVYNGITGVWMPESNYRQYREDQRKGFTYYTNWQLSEASLTDLRQVILNEEQRTIELKANHDRTKKDLSDCDLLYSTSKDELLSMTSKYNKSRGAKRFWQVATVVVGAVGVYGGFKLAQ